MRSLVLLILALPILTVLVKESGSSAAELQAFTGHSGCRGGHGFEATQGGVRRNDAAAERIQRIGARLVRGETSRKYHFVLLGSHGRNAYSLSCGCVYATRGLCDAISSDAELAAILAHEVGHVRAQDGRHPCRDDSCQLARELQADQAAFQLLGQAAYDVRALPTAIERLRAEQPAEWADLRINAAWRTLAQHGPAATRPS